VFVLQTVGHEKYVILKFVRGHMLGAGVQVID
jgi:hypothetical protein